MRYGHRRITHQFCYLRNGRNYHHLLYMYVFFESGNKDVFIRFLRTVMVHYEDRDLLVVNYYPQPQLLAITYLS